ncbi:MAG: antibiotic biosynthesis monooxygenase family protein [Trebonia sp.]
MALTATLDLRLKADKLDTAFEVIHETLTATRAFPGCLGVSVLVDSADPAHVLVLETWESPEADNAYRQWRATPEGASNLGSLVAAAPSLTLFSVAEGV